VTAAINTATNRLETVGTARSWSVETYGILSRGWQITSQYSI